VLVWGFLRLRLLDLLPVVRGAVVSRMADAVLVVDAYGRLVYANPSGERLLVAPRRQLVGRSLADLLPDVAEVVGDHRLGATTRAEINTLVDGRSADLAVVVTSVSDPAGRQTASVVVLSDVSDRLRIERRLRDLLDEQTRLAETLQASLRPAKLPEVPGAVLAARSVPAGRDGQLSGDFFDVHPASGGRWAFVLGDVAGKGVHAAVVTALARYTVRTLSAQGWTPREVLAQLNQALLARGDIERFATVVYGQVEAMEAGRLRVTVTLGGHPQPLIRRAGGAVEAFGRPGTALGLLADVDVHDQGTVLETGDLMLAYTDGVTEARRSREQFGEARLQALLGGVSDGAHPDTVADAVLAALSQFSTDRDDIALLVLAPRR
jgi:PAS domain S-box-containing protein